MATKKPPGKKDAAKKITRASKSTTSASKKVGAKATAKKTIARKAAPTKKTAKTVARKGFVLLIGGAAKKATAGRATAKKSAAKRPAAKKAVGGYYGASGGAINMYVYCIEHGIPYPRGEACPRCR